MSNEISDIMNMIIPLDLKDVTLPDPEEITYWKLRKNRTFFIDFEIDEDYDLVELGKVITQMNMEEMTIPKEELKPIYLFIHSFGGDLSQTQYFIDMCIASRIPIVTIGMGVAMSAGFYIFLAGHKRYAFKHCQMMVHSGSAGFQGTSDQVEEAQKNYKKNIEDMRKYVLERTNIDPKMFNKYKNKDWYLNSDELLKYGIVDKIIDSFEDIL